MMEKNGLQKRTAHGVNMVRLKRILEDAEVIFDNPDARVPLALVSMEDFQLIAQMIIEEVHQVIVVGGVDDLDGVLKHFEVE